MVFFTLYLQLLGMSDFAASLLMAVFLGGTAVGEFWWLVHSACEPMPDPEALKRAVAFETVNSACHASAHRRRACNAVGPGCLYRRGRCGGH